MPQSNQLQPSPPKPPQTSTEEDKPFTPSKGMQKWLQAAMELGHTAQITAIAKEAGLDRDNWYQWLEKPGFAEWWDEQWHGFFRANRWKLDAIGMKKAEENFDYWHTMMERADNIAPKGPGVAVQVNNAAPITDEQLRRIIAG